MTFLWLMLAAASQAGLALAAPPIHARACSFTENLGQWDTPARFVGEVGDTLVRIEPAAIWLHKAGPREGASGRLLRLSFEGGSSEATLVGLRTTPTLHSFFVGNDPANWIHAARSYQQVRLTGVYPGIDVVLGARDGSLKYDVIVAPGADVARFVVRCEGADALCMDPSGDLRIEAGTQPLLSAMGNAWEETEDGSKRAVHPRWRLLDGDRFGIALAGRDSGARLVIDPDLSWATYLGSSSYPDEAAAVDVADDGSVVVVGVAGDLSFPTTPGSVVIAHPAGNNVFVTMLSANGGSLVYSAIIGGSVGAMAGTEYPRCVSLDGSGRSFVTGLTTAPDFPTTPGAFDRQFDGGGDGFALMLSASGDVLEYSTLLGGSSGDEIYACAATSSGALVVAGFTSSSDFPTSANAFQLINNGGEDTVVARVNPTGSGLEWSTYLGGLSVDRCHALALADNDDVLITGKTNSQNFPTTPGTFESVWQGSTFDFKAFVARLHSSGSALVWSTFLGGPDYSGSEGTIAYGIGVIPSGDVFVCGGTREFDFPTTPAAFQTQFHYNPPLGFNGDGFLTRFNPVGSSLMFSTLLGTDYAEAAIGIALDASGLSTIASRCGIVPTTPGCFQSIPTGGLNFAVSRFHPSGSRLIHSTIVGGPNEDVIDGIGMSRAGRVTLVGYTNGNFPTTAASFDPTFNGGQYDGVVATLELHPTGVTSIGTSTPACHGPLILQVSEMPQSGSTSFSLMCSSAPPLARGVLLIGRTALSQPTYVGAAALWVDPRSRLTSILPLISDMDGFVEVDLPLTGVPIGSQFAAQALFRQRPQCVVQGLTCASQALVLDIQ